MKGRILLAISVSGDSAGAKGASTKKLLVLAILVVAVLALTASPAFAYYNDPQPGTAYLWPFGDENGAAWWAEVKGGEQEWSSAPIPRNMPVVVALGWASPTLGNLQVEPSRDFYAFAIAQVGGGYCWSISGAGAAACWTPIYVGEPGPSFNKDWATYYVRDLWVPVGKLSKGSYTVSTVETVTVMITDLSWLYDGQKTPIKTPPGTYDWGAATFSVK